MNNPKLIIFKLIILSSFTTVGKLCTKVPTSKALNLKRKKEKKKLKLNKRVPFFLKTPLVPLWSVPHMTQNI